MLSSEENMKVTFGVPTLKRLASPCTAVVKKNNPSPILTGVHITAHNELNRVEAVFYATDGERTIRATVPISALVEPGECVVDAHLLFSLLDTCNEGIVTLDVAESGKATLFLGKSKYTIPTHPAKDYPPDVTPQGGQWCEVLWGAMRPAIQKAFASANKPKTGSNSVIDGVRLEGDGRGIMVAGTDGSSRTVLIDLYDALKVPFKGTLPAEAVADVLSLFQGDVEMLATDKAFSFRDGNLTYTTRLFAGDYLPIRNIYNRVEYPHRVTVNKAALQAALRRVGLILGDAKDKAIIASCQLVLSPWQLSIRAENASTAGEGREIIEIDYNGPSVGAKLRHQLLLEAMSIVDGDTVEIGFKGGIEPFGFKAPSDEKFYHMIQPLAA